MAKNQRNSDTGTRSRRTTTMYIIVSILASLALWIYITYIENPERTTYVSDIPIQFDGEEALIENDLMLVSVNTRDLDIRFSGRWNTLSKLSDTNITATVDLSVITTTYASNPGTYTLSYKLNYGNGVSSSGISIASANYSFVTVTVEKLVTTTVQIKGSYDGTLADGYIAEPLEYSVDSITVSGPQAEVSQIAYASVSLVRDELSRSISEDVPVTLIDKNGSEVNTEGLILSQDTVNVTVRVLMVKDYSLTVALAHGASTSDANVTTAIDPPKVTLSGDPDSLPVGDEILLGTIDMREFLSSGTYTFPVRTATDVNNLTGITTATVTVRVIDASSRRLSVTNIRTRNETEGYVSTVITQSLDVVLRGNEASLQNVRAENIRIVADLAELGNATGNFVVKATVYIDGFDDVDAIGDYVVTVSVTIPSDEPEPEPEPEPEETGSET